VKTAVDLLRRCATAAAARPDCERSMTHNVSEIFTMQLARASAKKSEPLPRCARPAEGGPR